MKNKTLLCNGFKPLQRQCESTFQFCNFKSCNFGVWIVGNTDTNQNGRLNEYVNESVKVESTEENVPLKSKWWIKRNVAQFTLHSVEMVI